MAKMNTLFRKGYLLAGVMMAANIFTVNEVKAMDKDKIVFEIEGIGNEENTIGVNNNNKMIFFTKDSTRNTTRNILFRENYFNFFGTLALSVANNYLKLWDYNPGWYRQFGCLGWISKSLLNGIFQFEVNFINLGRGISWGFLGFWFLFVYKRVLQ